MMASFFNILVHILFLWNNHTYKQEHILHRKLPAVLQILFLLLEKVNLGPKQMLLFTWSPTRGEGSSGSHIRETTMHTGYASVSKILLTSVSIYKIMPSIKIKWKIIFFMTCHWGAPLVMNWKGLWRFCLQRSKLQWTSQIRKCGLPLQWLTFSSWALEQTMLCSTEWAFEWHAAVTETLWYPACCLWPCQWISDDKWLFGYCHWQKGTAVTFYPMNSRAGKREKSHLTFYFSSLLFFFSSAIFQGLLTLQGKLLDLLC